jgi:hypothetical protein
MHEEVLQVIHAEVRIALQEILANARGAGWIISRIRWLDMKTGTLEFSATNPRSGKNAYTMCSERDIVNRLRSLLSVEG